MGVSSGRRDARPISSSTHRRSLLTRDRLTRNPTPNPMPDDYDNDGLSKHDEIFTTHTNPLRADTDFDGVNDGDEYRNGTNPLDPRSP